MYKIYICPTKFLYTACLPTRTASPTINIQHQSAIFAASDVPTLTHHCCPKSIVYIKVHSWCYTFDGFEQMYNDRHSPL